MLSNDSDPDFDAFDNSPWHIVGVIVLLLLILVTLLTVSYKMNVKVSICHERKIVMATGTCHNGTCSVMYTDMTFGTQYLPIAGQEVCSKEESVE
jgi:hypothetical protein